MQCLEFLGKIGTVGVRTMFLGHPSLWSISWNSHTQVQTVLTAPSLKPDPSQCLHGTGVTILCQITVKYQLCNGLVSVIILCSESSVLTVAPSDSKISPYYDWRSTVAIPLVSIWKILLLTEMIIKAEKGKNGQIYGDRRLDLGGEHTVQCTDDVL